MIRNARRCTHATERMTAGSDGASPSRFDLKLFSFDASNESLLQTPIEIFFI